MTAEQRRQAIDFGKIRGTGMPVPMGHIFVEARAHILNLYYEVPPNPSTLFFWRNRSKIGGTWSGRSAPASSWGAKLSPSSNWKNRLPTPDGNVQSES